MLDFGRRVHFVGIGGIGMSALARILAGWGVKLSGSDLVMSDMTKTLAKLGITVYEGHAAENLAADVDLLVYSSVIKPDNPEYAEAKRRGIRIFSRGELLAEMLRLRYGIAVAGAHGKTTTTGMIGTALLKLQQQPTIVVGGVLANIGANSCWGLGEYMVAEADESDGSFLQLPAKMAVVTNVENDHLDHYGSMENLIDAFRQFIEQLPSEGCAVIGLDCPALAEMEPGLKANHISFAVHNAKADYTVGKITYKGFGSTADVFFRGERLGVLRLNIPGEYNIQNALAAIAALHSRGFAFKDIAAGLADFRGTRRRFELMGEDKARNIRVYDDYAHHPSEIIALLDGAANVADKRLVVVFQPHRYTRTKLLFDEFAAAFGRADVLILDEIYPAFEQPIEGVTSLALAKAVRAASPGLKVHYAADAEEVLAKLDDVVEDGDVVMIVGAGNIRRISEAYGEVITARANAD